MSFTEYNQLLYQGVIMGAFNYIRIKGTCPVCKREANILCQTHIASDYDGNLEVNRFHDHVYEMGQKMPWFIDDPDSWYTCEEFKIDDNRAREGCYSKCEVCKSDIYVLLEFEDRIPSKVIEIGLEDEMPRKYQ